jgi:hypothetical protein
VWEWGPGWWWSPAVGRVDTTSETVPQLQSCVGSGAQDLPRLLPGVLIDIPWGPGQHMACH